MTQRPNLIEDCCLCTEIGANRIPDAFSGNCSLETRIVFSTNNFVVLPSVTPLVEGHVLLLPKRHVTSLAQVTRNNREELNRLLQFIYGKVGDLWTRPIIFEHGIGEEKTGGCGVTHAHLHIVPLHSRDRVSVWSSLAQKISDFPSQAPLLEILDNLGTKDSYLIIGDDPMKISCRVSDSLPSQLMRQLIADTLLLPGWDWRDMSNWKYIESTYHKLKGAA